MEVIIIKTFKSLYDYCIENNRQDLLDEWDYDKNKNITPKDVSYGSNKKVWWIIHYYDKSLDKTFDLSWDASVEHRRNGRKCPYLTYPIKKILPGFNDLKTRHPELMKEWDYSKNTIDPSTVSSGAVIKVWWICPKGHSYLDYITDRTKKENCPICSSTRIIKGINDFGTLYPELLKEWDYNKNKEDPFKLAKGSSKKKYWWICPLGHSYQAKINNRTSKEATGCPYCSNKKIIKGFNDLKTLHPEVIDKWDYSKNKYDPSEFSVGSSYEAWWICERGHSYKCDIYSEIRYNHNCPKCLKELRTSFPEKIVYYYIKKEFNNVIENYTNEWLGRREIDVYIPEYKLGIEFDGHYYHKDYIDDLNKDILLDKHGITLIRIRTKGCPEYESNSYKVFCDVSSDDNVIDSLRCVYNIINNKYNLNLECNYNLEDDYHDILNNYLSLIKEHNIKKDRIDLYIEWDFTKNKHINPELISLKSNRMFWWKCSKCGSSFKMMMKSRTNKKHNSCPICSKNK